MENTITITSARLVDEANSTVMLEFLEESELPRLVFLDGDNQYNDLLNSWLAEGNTIEP